MSTLIITKNSMNKVLITGAGGQLGSELVEVFRDWDVFATDLDTLDITDKEKVISTFKKEKPDWVIHCAAWTDVEGCAENPEKAMKINAEATKYLAQATKEIGAKMIYISTNEVFDGKKTESYVETDLTNPINPYAASKLAGEKFIQEILGEDGVIVRTSWVYGPKGKSNFPLKIIAAADKFGELKVVDDEVAVPTYAPDLATAVFELVAKNPSGVYHLVNEGECSRYDWAKQLLDSLGIEVPIQRTKLADFARLSSPPKHAVLSNEKASKMGIIFRNWSKASEEYLTQINRDSN